MIYKSIPQIEQVFLGSTAIGRIFNGSDLVFKKDDSPYSGDYIIFEDPDVKSYIVSQYGNKSIGEITYAQAAAVTDFSYFSWDGVIGASTNPFYNNSNINYFDELQYFTGLSTIAGTFGNCTRLYSVELPDSITRIELGTFYRCTHLENITLPPNLTYIGMNAFNNCDAFTEIVIPDTVTYIGLGAFAGCDNLAYVTLPSYITEIADSLLVGTAISYIDIPDTVTYIGAAAFNSCKNLTSVVLPNSVTTIGDGSEYSGAFGSSGLTSITIPSSVTYIGKCAFAHCLGLTSVTLPNSVTHLGDYVFLSCSNLTSVTLPNNITSIGNQLFYACSSLASVDIPTSVTSIGNYAFENCTSLTSITIPASVTSMGLGVLRGCSSLTSITCKATTPPTLGDGYAFDSTNDCPINVPSVSVDSYKATANWVKYKSRIRAIPTNISFADNDVKTIIVNKYGSNGEITDAQAAAVTTFMSGMNKTSNPFYNNASVDEFTELAYFTGITAIGNFTFYKCSNMKSVIIPANVTSIGTQAFQQCSSLTSVTIPASVTEIKQSGFMSCTSLTSITCLATTPPTLGNNALYSTNNCPIYVPAASVDAYKQSWSSLSLRIQAIPA